MRHMAAKGATEATIAMVYGLSERRVRALLKADIGTKQQPRAAEPVTAENCAPGQQQDNGASDGHASGESPVTESQAKPEEAASENGPRAADDAGSRASGGAGTPAPPDTERPPPPKSAKRLMLGQGAGGWRPRTCQYIASASGRKDTDKCGAPVQEDSAYCPEHHQRCWVKPGSRLR